MSTAVALVGSRRAFRVVERNARTYVRMWPAFLSGFLEPVFYLFSIGIGVGALVGDLPGPGGRPVAYDVFVAPAMLATSAMNGTVFDTTFNFFFKFKYAKTFDGMLATPLGVRDIVRGEVTWALLRAVMYATVFLATMWAMDLIPSAWAVLALPAALLIGFGFAGAGMGLTTFMRSFVDFDYVQLAIVPLFLFSATFFPLSEYPAALGWVVRCSPLYQGVALERALVLGDVSPVLLLHAGYLAAMGRIGLRVAGRRLGALLQP
ncbi:MAG TPA: ABC transporter permease [Acidimicrobiales bacterium]|nr:ABC transporter permease [Acidimicrobiales bacterium]